MTFFFCGDVQNVHVQMRGKESKVWKHSQGEGWREKGEILEKTEGKLYFISFKLFVLQDGRVLWKTLYEFVTSSQPFLSAACFTHGVITLDKWNNRRVVTFLNNMWQHLSNILSMFFARLYVSDIPLQSAPVWHNHLFPRLLFSPNGWCATWLPSPTVYVFISSLSSVRVSVCVVCLWLICVLRRVE